MHSPLSRLGGFSDFIRLRICFLTSFISVTGFMLHGNPQSSVLLIYASSFLVCAAVYAHNNMTDREEDRINRSGSRLPENRRAILAVVLLCSAGMAISVMAGPVSFAGALAFILLGVAYNSLRIKRLTLVKNLYTALLISLLFLLGVSQPGARVVYDFVAVYVIFLTGSIISDIRDIKGDVSAGFRTLPAMLGERKAKYTVYFLMAALFAMTLYSPNLRPLIPFQAVVFLLVKSGRMDHAHKAGGLSILFLTGWHALFLLA